MIRQICGIILGIVGVFLLWWGIFGNWAHGQCIGGSCPTPSAGFNWGAFVAPSYQVIEPMANRLQPDYAWHQVEHNGVQFSAWGYVVLKQDGRRVISWDAELNENKSHYWKAAKAQEAAKEAAEAATKRAASDQGVVKPPAKPVEPEPSAKIGPFLDPQLPQRSGEEDKLPTDRKLTLAKMGTNFGIDESKLGLRSGYSENGHAVSTKRVENKMEKPLEPRSFVIVIGSPEERKQIETDWKNDERFRPYRDLAYLTPYNPTDWQIEEKLGFRGTGHPTIIVESPDRVVVGRADSYTGPEDVIEGLRRAHPRYNPANDRPLGKAMVWSIDRPRVIAAGTFGVVLLMLWTLPRRRTL
jgi:hypothetical protein